MLPDLSLRRPNNKILATDESSKSLIYSWSYVRERHMILYSLCNDSILSGIRLHNLLNNTRHHDTDFVLFHVFVFTDLNHNILLPFSQNQTDELHGRSPKTGSNTFKKPSVTTTLRTSSEQRTLYFLCELEIPPRQIFPLHLLDIGDVGLPAARMADLKGKLVFRHSKIVGYAEEPPQRGPDPFPHSTGNGGHVSPTSPPLVVVLLVPVVVYGTVLS